MIIFDVIQWLWNAAGIYVLGCLTITFAWVAWELVIKQLEGNTNE